jgi:ABC-type amino acid transport substrate-binding protein
MTATPALTSDLQRQVLLLEGDLRDRIAADAELEGRWKQEHQRALEKERTAASWVAWRDDRVTQAAVAWVLSSVFIRFCEDNALVAPVWITGPENRRQEALDAQLAYFRAHPEDTDREWLHAAIDYLAGLPTTRSLVDAHSALRLVSPSGDAVTALLDFWRRRGENGALMHDLADSSLSTRFLGDLYQDLSQHAKDIYALLQTPVFVEEFILDRTLEPALKERPLEGFKLIDPTCGSGHFLLGAFHRLLDRWHRHAPGLELQARVQAAFDAIHGVDLNPFAVAIARFRLTVTALQASGLTSLEAAPAFTFHLAVGDSLIHGPDPDVLPGMSDRSAFMPFTYATEDGPLLLTLLEEGRYDVVVGNPPYIAVKDKALNQIYRSKYANVCKGKYALTAPFMAQFFALAKGGERAGWIGQITSNSFMKREFGTKLIEDFLAHQDLRLVADTSGAYIPGHGTPTVIIVGRNQRPEGSTLRAILGIRGEPGRPNDPAKGIVWSSIVDHVEEPGWSDNWLTVTDLDRRMLAAHPWSLGGGGAVEVQLRIERASLSRVGQKIHGKIGPASFPGADDCFFAPKSALARRGISDQLIRDVVTGEVVRDWEILPGDSALVPYLDMTRLLKLDTSSDWYRWLWPNRTVLGAIIGFERETRASSGDPWWSWYRWVPDRYRTPLSLCFAVVATQNNFALAQGTGVFNRHAPVIKLAERATADEYLAMLGVLNSSTACFWLKQNSHNKGEGGGARVDAGYAARGEPFRETYEFTGTTLQNYPLPRALPLDRAQLLDSLAHDLSERAPHAVIAVQVPTVTTLANAQEASRHIRAQMTAVQEELDWEMYGLYGLIDKDLNYEGDDMPGLMLGERAFEIALARAVQAGDEETSWFTHPEQRSTPITDIPAHWPTAYRDLVQRRLDLIATNPSIGLLERPEYKRRWAQEPWEKRQERALREWLLGRLEERRFWFDAQGRALPRSVAQLADEVTRAADLVLVLALWEGRPDVPVTQSLVRLLADEAVPFLAGYRYKDSGLRKREAWGRPGGSSVVRMRAIRSARSRFRRSTPRRTSASTRTGRRGASWMCRRSDSSSTLMRAGRPIRRRCLAGPDGIMLSSRWRCRWSSGSGRRTAGPTTGLSLLSRAWPSCSRGWSSGTARSTRATA